MPLGWIDFSKTERIKVLNVLDLLSEGGVLDELGIAPVRDGFSDIFFPGTSTIQTRAKYFFIVPYALKDMELSADTNPGRVRIAFDAKEKASAKALVELHPGAIGIIGKNSLVAGKWVKRTPADIYWSSLRQYGIFIGGNLSLTEYISAMCKQKVNKNTINGLGHRNDSAEEHECDDVNAGDIRSLRFWRMPLYKKSWFDEITLKLTKEEGQFLMEQIISFCPNTMLQYVLENRMTEILEIGSFQELAQIIHKFPVQIQTDYKTALSFSDFIYVIRAIYNVMISDGMNEAAQQIVRTKEKDFCNIANIDVDAIFARLSIYNNPALHAFLKNSQELMKHHDIDGLKRAIKNREIALKGQSRAKTCHPGQFENVWLGGGELGYRYKNAAMIIRDIFESEA